MKKSLKKLKKIIKQKNLQKKITIKKTIKKVQTEIPKKINKTTPQMFPIRQMKCIFDENIQYFFFKNGTLMDFTSNTRTSYQMKCFQL